MRSLQRSKESGDASMPTVDNYINLLAVCRPFFRDYDKRSKHLATKIADLEITRKEEASVASNSDSRSQNLEYNKNVIEGPVSSPRRCILESEASTHTSFLATTANSVAESTSSSNSSSSLFSQVEDDSNVSKSRDFHRRPLNSHTALQENDEEDESDSSSMVVLARSKKKHKHNQRRHHHHRSHHSGEQDQSHTISKSSTTEENISNDTSKDDEKSTNISTEKNKASSSLPNSDIKPRAQHDLHPPSSSLKGTPPSDTRGNSISSSTPASENNSQESLDWSQTKTHTHNINMNRQSTQSSSSDCNRIIENNGSETTNTINNAHNSANKSINKNQTSDISKRVVTDTSASDSKANNNTSSSSGSGSGSGSGNGSSGSGNGSGSGGSGGSGNETTMANENSGSTSADGGSDEGLSGSGADNGTNNRMEIDEVNNFAIRRGDMSGNIDGASFENPSGGNTEKATAPLEGGNSLKLPNNHHHRHYHNDVQSHSSHKQPMNPNSSTRHELNAASCQMTSTPWNSKDGTDGSHYDEKSHQQKLLSKKRKRMNKRREYEEQQHCDSSDSSIPAIVLQPGKPVTLEDVLFFSKKAR